jgi:adenosylcobinamide-GDP ribazoletransferase
MAHGDRERRIRALTDRNVGAGGIAAGIAVTLLLFAGLQSAPSIVFALIIGEVCAKFSMAYLTTYGKPFRLGIHSYLHQYSQPYFPAISIILCIPLILIPIAPIKIMGAFLSMILCPMILLAVSERLFGGINGDVAGASNEITRACVILAVAIL